jgi:hypothetical protein
MKKNFTLFSLFILVSLPNYCSAQNYLGSWTLDWSKVMESDEQNSSMVSEDMDAINTKSDKNPVWVLSKDSLKIYQSNALISSAEIKWTREDRFEIIDEEKKKNPVHYIDEIDEGQIKMRTGYSDAELYLRRL